MQEDVTEEWRPVVGYEGYYSVSNIGRVRRELSVTSGKAGHVLAANVGIRGYRKALLSRDGQRTHSIHALVAAAFLGPRPARWQINHKNGDKLDNSVGNLEYCSPRANSWHAAETGLRKGRAKNQTPPAAEYTAYRFGSPLHVPDTQPEQWRPVVGYEGWYSVSSLGQVRREPRTGRDKRSATAGGLMQPALDTHGYRQLSLSNGRRTLARTLKVHTLVAAAFLGPCPEGMSVNHRDGDHLNNRPSNLEYVTQRQQIHHAWALGLARAKRGSQNGAAKLTEADVLDIRRRYAADPDASPLALAAEYGVTYRNIWLIVSRKIWQHC